MRLYGEISKVEPQDDGTIKVYGIASSPALDAHGEVVTSAAMKAAIPDYLAFPTIREMHDATKAAGRAIEIGVDDDGSTSIVAHVVDPIAITKVKNSVYAGFSIGGRIKKRNADDRTIIEGLELVEISLVDRPSCPEAVVSLWKSDTPAEGDDPADELAKTDAPTQVEEPAETAEEIAKVDPVEDLTDAQKAASEADAIMKSVMATLERLEKGAEVETAPRPIPPALVAGLELRKGMYDLRNLGCILSDLAYAIFNADWETSDEGDASPVPAKLRTAFNALVEAYRAMSDEEIAELVASVNGTELTKAAVISLGDLAKVEGELPAEQIEALTGAIKPLLAKGLALADPADDTDRLTKVAEADDRLAKAETAVERLTTENATLHKSVGDMTAGLAALRDRVEKLATEPLPSKTAGSVLARAVSKEEDVGRAIERPAFTEEDVQKVLAALPADERAMLLIKAAHKTPRAANR
jgi:hypothetical protein